MPQNLFTDRGSDHGSVNRRRSPTTSIPPATKAIPKEMLPIVDKPLIQYAAEEAVAAGITELIFITGRTKRSITDHFDKAYELETELEKKGKTKELEIVKNISQKA